MAALELCVARIYSNKGKVIGAGCLVSQKHILTCAHVIADALGIPRQTSKMPDEIIILDFPLLITKQHLKAKVVFWQPVNPTMNAEDIAVLELENFFTQLAQPAKFITSDDLWGHSFRVFGFPLGQPNGVSATGVLRGRGANSWVQLEDIKESGYRLEVGFSGAPIWDEELEGVVGIAVAAEMNRPEVKAAFMIPALILGTEWKELNIVTQEINEKMKVYSSRIKKLVFASYSRSGQVDQDCEKYLLRARNDLGLSSLDTAIIENELFWLCQNLSEKIRSNIVVTEQDVSFFVKDSFERYFELEKIGLHEMLEQLKFALGLNELNANRIFILSINNYGNKLIEYDARKAIVVFEQALHYSPSCVMTHIGLGSAFLKTRLFLKAIKIFQKAKEIGCTEKINREDISIIDNLICNAKEMLYRQILAKTLSIFSFSIITKIIKKIVDHMVRIL
jgi:hypothetical protein